MLVELIARRVTLALSGSAFATDQVEDLMTQITFTGKVGDTKIFSADAQELLEMGLKFPKDFAELYAENAKVYWIQMKKIPVRNEGSGPRVEIIESKFYATNQLCGHPMCSDPAKVDYRVLTILREYSCSGAMDAACTVKHVSNGIRTETKDALFWLAKTPQ